MLHRSPASPPPHVISTGVDYWLIRTSWSKLWGDDGYIKITRKGNDCGITTGAVQAVVDMEAVNRARGTVA